MADQRGYFGAAAIPWFNGGLFGDDDVLPLGLNQLNDLRAAARLDWSAIDPAIFGTLSAAPPLAAEHRTIDITTINPICSLNRNLRRQCGRARCGGWL